MCNLIDLNLEELAEGGKEVLPGQLKTDHLSSTRVYLARDFIFFWVQTKLQGYFPSNLFEFNVFVCEF